MYELNSTKTLYIWIKYSALAIAAKMVCTFFSTTIF